MIDVYPQALNSYQKKIAPKILSCLATWDSKDRSIVNDYCRNTDVRNNEETAFFLLLITQRNKTNIKIALIK